MNEQLIYKYLSGQASRAEELELLEWLTVSEDNKKIFFEIGVQGTSKCPNLQEKQNTFVIIR